MTASIADNEQAALESIRDSLRSRLNGKLDAAIAAGMGPVRGLDSDDIIVHKHFFRQTTGEDVTLLLPAVLIAVNGEAAIEPRCTPEQYWLIPVFIGVLFQAFHETDEDSERECNTYTNAAREALEDALFAEEMWAASSGAGVRHIRNWKQASDFLGDRDRHLRLAVLSGEVMYRGLRRHNTTQGLGGSMSTAYGEMNLSVQAATTLAPATPAKMAGTTLAGQLTSFDMPADNRLRYLGASSGKFLVNAAISLESDTAGVVNTLCFAKNGTIDSTTSVVRKIVVPSEQGAAALTAIVDLDQNDYLELWGESDLAADLTLTKLSMTVVRLDG